MNERIKQLYKQAAQFGQDDYNNRFRNRVPLYDEDEFTNIVNQKFAELIVEECIKLNGKELAMAGHSRMVDVYCEHFGIEL
jgi:hypothetical protein